MARHLELRPDAGPRTRGVLLGAYAAATFLAFPQYVAGRAFDLGLVCAWLAPGLLIAAVRNLPPARAARSGLVAGWVAHIAVLHWIYVVTVTYGHAPPVVGALAPAGLAAYVALFVGAFAAGVAWLARRGAANVFVLAAWWTALDYLRSFALTGFPWATLGYAQHENALLVPLCAWTGVYGLSFASVLGGAALAEVLRARGRPPAPALAALAVLAALHGVGGVLARGEEADTHARRVRVAVLQGNVDQGLKWRPARAERTLEIYEDLSRRAAARGAELIVWPETAVPGSVATDAALRARIGELARAIGAELVVGGMGVEPEGDGLRFFDSAFLFDRRGRLTDRYDKAHLVPFGEYVPLRSLLGGFLSALARGLASEDVAAGSGPRAVRLLAGADGGSVTAGVPICYELLFPDLVRRFVEAGGEVLLAITNDAWYGRTGAPYQFLAMTAVRSAENRVWTARAANTGVSAFIDHRGRVRERTGIFERDLLVADVPLRPPPLGGSFYARRGDVFAVACSIGVGAWGLFAGGRRRARSEGDGGS